jgi:hypothetical protein
MLPFVLALGDAEAVTARAGLPLVLEAFRSLRLDEEVALRLKVAKRRRGFTEAEKLEALLLLLCAGGERVEDIRILSEDKGLLRLLNATLPSPDALLDFLAAFHVETPRPESDEASWVPPESPALKALHDVNCALVARAASRAATVATIDHDGTLIESHKDEATRTYEGFRGYQPLVALWAEEGLVVADEFRDGNVPGGKDPLASVRRAFESLPPQVTVRRFRGDSADYHLPLLKYLVKEDIGFTISADMSRELRAVCIAVPDADWHLLETRQHESVHLAEVEFAPADWSRDARPLRYVAIRFSPKQSDFFDAPKYLAIVSNREDISPAELARWHWARAGTIEHVHRVMKDELGAAVLPSGRFGANAAWFRINALAFNLLAVLRRRVLPAHLRDARPKRLRFEVFTLPGRLSVHQRQLVVQVSADGERGRALDAARTALAHLWESDWGAVQ